MDNTWTVLTYFDVYCVTYITACIRYREDVKQVLMNDVADVDLFGAKPFTVPTPGTPPTSAGDVFGMPVFSPLTPSSMVDQEMLDMQVLCCIKCVCSLIGS